MSRRLVFVVLVCLCALQVTHSEEAEVDLRDVMELADSVADGSCETKISDSMAEQLRDQYSGMYQQLNSQIADIESSLLEAQDHLMAEAKNVESMGAHGKVQTKVKFFRRAKRWVRRKARRAKRYVRRKARRVGRYVKRRARRAGRYVKRRARRVGRYVKRRARRVGRSIKRRARRVGRYVKRRARRVGRYVKRRARRAGRWIKRTARRTGKWVKRAARRTGKWVKKTSGKAWEGIKKGAKWLGNLVLGGLKWIWDKIKAIKKLIKNLPKFLGKLTKRLAEGFFCWMKGIAKTPKFIYQTITARTCDWRALPFNLGLPFHFIEKMLDYVPSWMSKLFKGLMFVMCKLSTLLAKAPLLQCDPFKFFRQVLEKLGILQIIRDLSIEISSFLSHGLNIQSGKTKARSLLEVDANVKDPSNLETGIIAVLGHNPLSNFTSGSDSKVLDPTSGRVINEYGRAGATPMERSEGGCPQGLPEAMSFLLNIGDGLIDIVELVPEPTDQQKAIAVAVQMISAVVKCICTSIEQTCGSADINIIHDQAVDLSALGMITNGLAAQVQASFTELNTAMNDKLTSLDATLAAL